MDQRSVARCESKDLLGEVFVDGSEPFLRGIQRGRPTWPTMVSRRYLGIAVVYRLDQGMLSMMHSALW